MSRQIWTFVAPTRCVVGTVGMPGDRTFYLQVSDTNRIMSLRIEKQQAAVLAVRTMELLNEVEAGVPADQFISYDAEPLATPIDEDFQVSAMALGSDANLGNVVIEAHEASDGEIAELGDDDDEAADTVRIVLSAAAAAQFASRTEVVVAAGRPPCPLCGLALEVEGHICPRANGYRRR